MRYHATMLRAFLLACAVIILVGSITVQPSADLQCSMRCRQRCDRDPRPAVCMKECREGCEDAKPAM